ncbi:hypothetical protein IQ269_17285 [Tychonema sp. LEGE 07199]|nr:MULTISPECIES: hypothetical protein [unclassified Tychonema]MBE9122504.1 hypothetical protein [Tychonema sp. LEGE 07199]MBE9133595.1 hypothetical protein [Tychonema sp. LEGE 07196]
MPIDNQTGMILLGLSDRLKITTHRNGDRNHYSSKSADIVGFVNTM